MVKNIIYIICFSIFFCSCFKEEPPCKFTSEPSINLFFTDSINSFNKKVDLANLQDIHFEKIQILKHGEIFKNLNNDSSLFLPIDMNSDNVTFLFSRLDSVSNLQLDTLQLFYKKQVFYGGDDCGWSIKLNSIGMKSSFSEKYIINEKFGFNKNNNVSTSQIILNLYVEVE